MERSSSGVDAERERHLLDSARDRRRPVAAALERECELGPHRAHHQLGLGILEQHPHERPQARGSVLARVEARERDPSGEAPAVEVRRKAAGGAQERRLAVAGEAREQAELARVDLQADVIERARIFARVAIGDLLEGQQRADHGSIPRRSQKGSSAATISATHSASVPGLVGMRTEG